MSSVNNYSEVSSDLSAEGEAEIENNLGSQEGAIASCSLPSWVANVTESWGAVSMSSPSCSESLSGLEVAVGTSNIISILELIVERASVDFVQSNICESEYKRGIFPLQERGEVGASGFPSLEAVVGVVLRVAVNLVVTLDDGCDFLLNSSDTVKRYFVSNLGIGESEVIRTLINTVAFAGFLNYSESHINSMSSSLVVGLSRDIVGDLLYFRDINYYRSLQARSSLDLCRVSMFFRKIVSLLVFFPEVMHPRFMNAEFSEEFFAAYFTPEGRCHVKVTPSNAIDPSRSGGDSYEPGSNISVAISNLEEYLFGVSAVGEYDSESYLCF
ncbi:hypothetical protein [Candidatus Ichthyocystis sparus]|uniref:hypothetical protein n=1 Tax=Candidatus Ichthyocystis sparus TaxID=1561004 RepID=UPI000B8998C6|nr:hypothetical protein [Candidatus Ichthyocystis sparus]